MLTADVNMLPADVIIASAETRKQKNNTNLKNQHYEIQI
jgi:hypothetical protein